MTTRFGAERVAKRRLVVLSTLGPHRRSREHVASRYGASTSRANRNLPAGVQSIVLRGAAETMFWLPEVRTLIPGDRSSVLQAAVYGCARGASGNRNRPQVTL